MLAHKSCMSGALRFCQGIPRIQDTWYRSQMTFPSSHGAYTHQLWFYCSLPAPPGGFDTLSRGPTYLTDPTQIPGLEPFLDLEPFFLDFSSRSRVRRSVDPHALIRLVFSQVGTRPTAPQKWDTNFFGQPYGCPQLGIPALLGLYRSGQTDSKKVGRTQTFLDGITASCQPGRFPLETTHCCCTGQPSKEWMDLLLRQSVSQGLEF